MLASATERRTPGMKASRRMISEDCRGLGKRELTGWIRQVDCVDGVEAVDADDENAG